MSLFLGCGDLAEPQASTAVCLLEACQQAGVVGCFAGPSSNVARQSLVRCANTSSAVKQVTSGHVCFGLPFKTNYDGHRKRSYACDATTVATFAPFLAIRIGSWSPSSKVIPPSCSPRTFCDCCPRNSFARSMRRTGGRISNDGWGESRPEVQMVWIRFAVWVDLRDGS